MKFQSLLLAAALAMASMDYGASFSPSSLSLKSSRQHTTLGKNSLKMVATTDIVNGEAIRPRKTRKVSVYWV
jgi:hypothetical protein